MKTCSLSILGVTVIYIAETVHVFTVCQIWVSSKGNDLINYDHQFITQCDMVETQRVFTWGNIKRQGCELKSHGSCSGWAITTRLMFNFCLRHTEKIRACFSFPSIHPLAAVSFTCPLFTCFPYWDFLKHFIRPAACRSSFLSLALRYETLI